jgi:dienelactone hydrolase
MILRGRRRGRLVAGVLLAAAMTGGSAFATAPGVGAQANPFQRGPDPTATSIAGAGPFAISSTTVGGGNGFGSATIYFPTDTSQGTFGGIAVAPGFTETQSALSWFAQRLATHGFVVINISTNSRFDQPPARATQLQNALNYLVNSSSVRTRVDGSRLGVAGHSMGGGGSIQATNNNRNLQASVPLMPYHTTKSWPGVVTPTLIVGAENDNTAPVANHAERFYTSMTSAQEKAYLELNGAGHLVSNSPNATISSFGVAWVKRYIDNDTRYEQFLCPPPAVSNAISEYRDTCPGS